MRTLFLRLILSCLTLLISLSLLSAQSIEDFTTQMDAYATQAVKDWQVPGLAMVVVKDGEVLFSKGYGVSTIGQIEKVDPKTLFLCASTTKAFTALGVGLLVDAGKLKWDDRVIDHLPNFQLFDPYVTREVRVRDLLCHRAGLGNADFLWTMQQYSSEEIIKRMRLIPPAYSFRAGYTYQNLMYLVAGKLIEHISGMDWGAFMKMHIYQPLDMQHTVPYLRETKGKAQLASPHYLIDGKVELIQHTQADEIGPAGSMWSNVSDMAKWLNFLIDSTKVEGKRMLKENTYLELFRPHTLIPKERFYSSSRFTKPHWTSYALGWFQHDYHGRQVDFHTGSLAGMVAIAGLIREEKIGIYIMANLDHAELRHALMYKAFDLLLGVESGDWSRKLLEFQEADKIKTDAEELVLESSRKLDTHASLPMSSYAGKYEHPLWGEVRVDTTEEALKLFFSEQNVLTATHWQLDAFRGSWNKAWYGKSLINFNVNAMGLITELEMWGMTFTKIE